MNSHDRAQEEVVDVTVQEGPEAPSVHAQSYRTAIDLHLVGAHVMKGPIEKPLDGDASTHRWACAPARCLTTVPPPYLDPLCHFACSTAAYHCGRLSALVVSSRSDVEKRKGKMESGR
jgi:hypothetical protein